MDTTGKQYSKKPLPKVRAERQLKALHINTGHGLYGGADDGDDAEIAGLMAGLNVQEPVEFVPAAAQPHFPVGMFEPPPRPRIRRVAPKRAFSTVQGQQVVSASKRQKMDGQGRGGQLDSQFTPNDINNVKLFLRGEAMWTLLPQIVRSYLGRVSVDTLTVPLGKLVRDSKNQGSTDSEADQELANEVVTNPAFSQFIAAVRADLAMAGQGLSGGRLSETWPMLKDHLDQVTTRIEFQQLPIGEKKPYLEEQMKAVILEMIHLLDEFHEKKDLITRGTTYIGKILSGTFTPDVEQQQKVKEGLAEVARKPVGQIVGNISASNTTPFFKRLGPSEHPSVSGNTYNPVDTRHYYNQSSTVAPYPTEVDPELPPHSLSQTLQTLSRINKQTGEYYDELVKQGVPAMTPAEVKARDANLKKGGRYSESDQHILIGDYLSGSGSGKWTALIRALGRLYNIPQKVVDATIAINDKQTGPLRFSAKRNNVLHQFRDYLDPTVVGEINDLEDGTVAEYAKAIEGRKSILNLRSVQTTNPLALHGQGLRGGIAVKLIKNADRTYSVAKVSGEILETVGTKREAELALTKWYKYQPPPPEPVVHKPVAKKGGPINWGEGKYKFVKKYLKGQGIPATKKNVAKICNIMDVEGVVFE